MLENKTKKRELASTEVKKKTYQVHESLQFTNFVWQRNQPIVTDIELFERKLTNVHWELAEVVSTGGQRQHTQVRKARTSLESPSPGLT